MTTSTYEPRYGVCKSLAGWPEVTAHTIAWFHYKHDAIHLQREFVVTCTVWDLVRGVKIK